MSEVYKSPLLVTGTLTPSGTQDVNIVSSITLNIAASSLPLPTGASTEATLLAAKIDLDKFTFTSTRLLVDGSGVIQPVSQSGSWTVSLASESIEIGTVDQGTGGASAWLVTGPLTNTQLRASPVPVTGTFTPSGTQDVNIVSTITLPVNGPLTDTQLRASAVAISGTVAATQSGTWNINNISGTVSLPTGAATETTLAAVKTDLDKLTFLSTRLLVDGSGVTQPISGTITANQGTSPWVVSGTITTSPNVNVHDGSGNAIASTGTSLNVDVTNTVPVTGTFFQATQPVSGTGNFTVVQPTGTNLHAVLDSGTLTSITNALPTGTNVIGHVIADSGSTTAVTGNVTIVQPTGTNLHTTVDNFPATQPVSGTVSVTQSTSPWVISASSLPLPTGAATEATLTTRLAEATFTARINTLGQKTSANSTPVVLASDQSAISVTPVFINSTTATLSNIAGSATSVTLLASNSSRKVATIVNDSTVDLYVKFGSTASTTSYTVLMVPNAYYEVPQPVYTGIITGIWASATGNARVTEIV